MPTPSNNTSEKINYRQRRMVTGVAIFFFVAVLCEIIATIYQHVRVPTVSDWKAAVGILRGAHKPGEPILFAPHWADPLGRFYFKDFLELPLQLLSDVETFNTVWEVSIRGQHHPWLQRQLAAQTYRFGQIQVSRYQQQAQQVVYDFTERAESEAVVEMLGDQTRSCPWNGRRFICEPVNDWNWAGPILAEVEHLPYRCLYAHPVDKQVKRISYAAAPLGRQLVVYMGIDDFASRKSSNIPVFLRVLINGHEIGRFVHQNDWPWWRTNIDTTGQDGQKLRVEFEISAPQSNARTFCFHAQARR